MQSVTKCMITTFLVKLGNWLLALKNHSMVTGKWYTAIWLPIAIDEIRKKTSKQRLILHHGNFQADTTF